MTAMFTLAVGTPHHEPNTVTTTEQYRPIAVPRTSRQGVTLPLARACNLALLEPTRSVPSQ
jgi:hypothetical protein